MKSLLLFGTVAGLVVATLVLAPRKYSSEAKLFVRVGRESVGLDPTVTTGEIISLQRENETEMNSIAELLHSRSLMETVVDSLGAESILNPPGGNQTTEEGTVWQVVERSLDKVKGVAGSGVEWVRSLDPITDRDRAIHELQEAVDISIPKRSSVVSVSFKAVSPQLAHDVVESLVSAYIEEHRRVNRTDGSFEFFQDQSELARTQLSEATQKLSTAKNELGISSVEFQKKLLHDQRSANALELAKSQAELAAATSRIAGLSELLEPISPRVTSDQISGHDNLAADNMRTRLYELELQKTKLLAQYLPSHPLVIEVEKQLVDAKTIYEQQPSARSRATSTINPTYQQLELELLTERGREAALRSQVAALGQQQQQLLAEQAQLNNQEVRIGEMERLVEVMAAEHRGQLAKLEQSRINEALEAQRISNVNIAQPATLVAKPVSPNKPIVTLLGMAIAFGGALLLPFWLDRGVRPDEIKTVQPARPAPELPAVIAERPLSTEGPPRPRSSAKQPVSA